MQAIATFNVRGEDFYRQVEDFYGRANAAGASSPPQPSGGVNIGDADEINTLFARQFCIVSRMMPAKTSYSYHGRSQLSILLHYLIRNCFSAILYILI